MSNSKHISTAFDSDAAELKKMGYEQQLNRQISGFLILRFRFLLFVFWRVALPHFHKR